MARKQWFAGLVGVGMLASSVASCDNPDLLLTPAEARAVALAILGSNANAQDLPDGHATASDVDVTEYDATLACPEGGTKTMQGTIEEDAESGTASSEGTTTYDKCDIGEITIVEGRISDARLFVPGPDTTILEGNWDGSGFLETDNGGSGECAVTLTEMVKSWGERPGSNWKIRIAGTVCGVSVLEEERGALLD